MGEKCMDLKGGYTAMRLLDLNSGPSGSDTTGIIRPCSTLSFPHLTSLESSFLYPARQPWAFSISNLLSTKRGGGARDSQSSEIRLRREFLNRFN